MEVVNQTAHKACTQVHFSATLDFNDISHAHDHYNYFRSKLSGAYGDVLGSQLDWMLDNGMQLFDEVCKTPILLSLLIVIISEQVRRHPGRDQQQRPPASSQRCATQSSCCHPMSRLNTCQQDPSTNHGPNLCDPSKRRVVYLNVHYLAMPSLTPRNWTWKANVSSDKTNQRKPTSKQVLLNKELSFSKKCLSFDGSGHRRQK